MPNFPDINPGAHVAVNTGFGMTAATPLDLRTIVTDLTMLQAMIDAHWMCEGMLIYALSTKKYYQIYTNDQNQIAYKLFEVESSQVEQATEADHLSHTVSINGVTTDFSGNEVNINRLMPTLISNYAQDFDATTTPGQYYGADGDSNNYLLTIEAIGDDKLIRTMTTIENGHIVVKQAIATKVSDVWTWGDWTLADGSVATAHISWLSPNVYINIPGGSLAERWIYSDSGSQYAANAATVQTADGQTFTVATPPTAAIDHPFVVKLFSDGTTKTAAVESLKATNDAFGKVKLSDSVTDDVNDKTKGVAATPKAVATLNGRITDEATARANADSTLQSNINSEASTRASAVASVSSALSTETSQRQSADSTLQSNINSEASTRASADSALQTRMTAAEAKLAKIPIGMIVMWSGSAIPTGWILCNGNNGNKVICADGVSRDVPDLRDRFIVGSGHDYSIGVTGGYKEITLSVSQMPNHRHKTIAPANDDGNPNGANDTSAGSDLNIENRRYWRGAMVRNYEYSDYIGGGQPHENRPPYYALAFIMFKG